MNTKDTGAPIILSRLLSDLRSGQCEPGDTASLEFCKCLWVKCTVQGSSHIPATPGPGPLEVALTPKIHGGNGSKELTLSLLPCLIQQTLVCTFSVWG